MKIEKESFQCKESKEANTEEKRGEIKEKRTLGRF
jgi:hypothetical protein